MAGLTAMALLWLCCLCILPASALPAAPGRSPEAMADSLTVSLVTCWPGEEIYELCGHEAIRVRGMGRDSVWNYGIFDFREPNFVYRFVKGETDYMVAGYPFEWFLPEYVAGGRKVVEQDLDLTQEEARRVLAMLQNGALPQNRRYRYNYVKNNCATRIHELLDSAVSARVIYPDSVRFGTFRNEMRAYHKDYPWYQFGIDLALGSGIDYQLAPREEMFVPLEMMRQAGEARMADGRKLVRATRVINEGRPDATLPPTPAWATPLTWAWLIGGLLIMVSAWSLIKRRILRWVFSLWFLLLGAAGTIVAFLVFISSHEATSPNTLLIWLNPLQLLFGICLWWRRTRPVAMAMAYLDVVAMVCMLVVWPFQNQSANPAFFPLMVATLLMAGVYAIIASKESYINNGRLPAGKSASKRRNSTGRGTSASGRRRKKETEAK